MSSIIYGHTGETAPQPAGEPPLAGLRTLTVPTGSSAIFAARSGHVSDVKQQVTVQVDLQVVGKVDEIHNLNHGTPAGEDLSDHLKYFTEHLPATLIYAGIDVERCGVFTGTRGRQLAGRCGLICTGAFPYRPEWPS